MASATDYLEQQIYNHIFRDNTFAKPTTIAIALSLSQPLDDGTFTEVANSNGYARYANASGNSLWSEMTAPGSGSNSTDFSFSAATGNWGTVSGVVITDDATYGGGNVLLYANLTTPKNVQNGDTFKFSAGDLDFSID